MAVVVYLCPIAAMVQYFTDSGIVLANGTISTYVAGTTEPVATYTDSTGTVANQVVIPLNEAGRTPAGIWQPQGVLLKIIIHDANGDQIGPTFDEIPGINDISDVGSIAVGQLLWPQNAAEIAANVVPMNYGYPNGPYRYGAVGNGVADDTLSWQQMVLIGEYHFVGNGTFRFTKKVQSNAFITVEGSSRQLCQITPTAFADYVLEIGATSAGPNPNVGALKRLRFFGGTSTNLGMLHMQGFSHMWNLSELLFQSSQCPGLVIDDCWDSFYSDLDFLSAGGTTAGAPSTNAMLIIRGTSNNIYFKGLRLEGAPNGVVYAAGTGPFYFVTGKIDLGFIPQGAAAVTITSACGFLSIDHFYIGGINNQYTINCQGGLYLGDVYVDGGTGMNAHIQDTRAWTHNDPVTVPGIAQEDIGPSIPPVRLNNAVFKRNHPSSFNSTPAALISKIFPIRLLQNTSVIAVGSASSSSINIAISFNITFNDQFTGCYLVHNADGYLYTSRRKILSCFTGGNMTLAGTAAPVVDGDYSIEYLGGHCTPIVADSLLLAPGMTMFANISTGCILVGSPTYNNSSSSAAYGNTTIGINGPNLAPNIDLTGYYLVDEATGEPYLIGYGIDGSSNIGVMYNVSTFLSNSITRGHTFRIQTGYYAGIRETSDGYEWAFAGKHKVVPVPILDSLGFDKVNLPLWGVGTAASSFTATLTGISAPVTATMNFSKQDNIVTLRLVGNLLGNSSTTAMSITGLPSTLIPASQRLVACTGITDGSVNFQSGSATINTDGSITFGIANVSGSRIVLNGAFTSSGVKGLDGTWEIVYSID